MVNNNYQGDDSQNGVLEEIEEREVDVWADEEGGEYQFEADYKIVSEEEVKKYSGKNMYEDLVNMGFLDPDSMSKEEIEFYKKILGNISKDGDLKTGFLYKIDD